MSLSQHSGRGWGYWMRLPEWSSAGGHPSSAGDFHQDLQPGPQQAPGSSTTQCDPHLIWSHFWNTLFNHYPAAALNLFQKIKVNSPLEWVGSFSWIPGSTGREKRNWLQGCWIGTGLMYAQPCCAALLHCFATACHSKNQSKTSSFTAKILQNFSFFFSQGLSTLISTSQFHLHGRYNADMQFYSFHYDCPCFGIQFDLYVIFSHL